MLRTTKPENIISVWVSSIQRLSRRRQILVPKVIFYDFQFTQIRPGDRVSHQCKKCPTERGPEKTKCGILFKPLSMCNMFRLCTNLVEYTWILTPIALKDFQKFCKKVSFPIFFRVGTISKTPCLVSRNTQDSWSLWLKAWNLTGRSQATEINRFLGRLDPRSSHPCL